MRTFSMVKPDGVERGLVGEIVRRIENKGLKIIASKLISMKEEQAKELYREHEGKPFYQGLVDFALSGPIFAMVIEGKEAVTVMRTLMGKTNPREAAPGTIRGDFGTGMPENIIHGSDAEASAEREIKIFFTEDEFLSYTRTNENRLGKE